MHSSIHIELENQLKQAWEKIGLSQEIQEALLQFMSAATWTVLTMKCREIALRLAEEGLDPEKIEQITGCSINEANPTITYH